ncbi:MAG TPA: GNAT family N-acetyltransferase [Polyangiaceae bacterium]|nr:GNAT family N-acetyltransferase [Polyangiaceae bacterium]
MTPSLADLAALLPDLPRWIEIRSMLLHGQARLIGPVATAPPRFVALHRDGDQAVVVGRASQAAIVEMASLADEILAVPDDEPWVAAALPRWKHESAVLFRRSTESPLPTLAPGEVRFLERGELAALTGGPHPLVPSTLRDELRDELASAQAAGTPIAAAFDGRSVAAFCYAGSITETLWDVAIDTLEPYRRRGHAMRAVSFLIEHYGARGQQPVWGAMVSNPASAALAGRLGFTPVDALTVFRAPGIVDT